MVERCHITSHQRPTIINLVGRRYRHRIRHDNVTSIPSRRHRPVKRIKHILCLLCNALPALRFTLLRLANRVRLAGLQGADIERLHGRNCIGERGAIGAIRRWGKRDEVEGLDPGNGDDAVVAGLGLFCVCGVRGWFGVDGDKVCDGTGGKEGSLDR